ncbi:hypothetical protein SAMN05216298_0752 [Glycomyces sambucus]|uniref:Uncharacterized protein n=1 Tax=Glycomyces sambucus TaxID=380244 RepID=A0A1G9D9K9_9ACTN|nr:DUF6518 family protein [Glycomyces sambucus]SDK60493.1 hypothetical protein SAMN05216298_0752 [Glycomyces sambucus]
MPDISAAARRPFPLILSVAIVGGLALGAVDLVAQRELPYPWANLANSSAVWAVGAFAIGAWVRAGRWQPAFAGAVLLVVAVESYYLAATLIQNDDLANLWAPTSLIWMAFGVLAGVVFGTFGAWSRSVSLWRSVVGTAALGAVFFAEAGVLLRRQTSIEPEYRADGLATAVITAAFGLALIVVFGRTWRTRLLALAAAVPLAALGFAGLTAAGFGS